MVDINMINVVLISGYKRSGKDHTASLIRDVVGNEQVETMSFATPIKEIAAKLLNVSIEDLELFKNNNEKISIENKVVTDTRSLLQQLGNDAIKPKFGKSVWADLVVNKIKSINDDDIKYIVIPDFRFNIEYDTLLNELSNDMRIMTLRIENNDINNIDPHPSETELLHTNFKFDYTLDNTGYCLTKENISIFLETLI